MESNDPVFPSPPTNRHSIISLVLGIFTLLFFCGSWVPIPFTGFICYPLSFLSGLFALIYGGVSLNTIRKKNETGGAMAWVGIFSGGLVFLCTLCFVILIISFYYFSPETIQPIIEGYQL